MGWQKILLTIVLIILACKDAECGGPALGRILSDSRPPLGLGAQFIVGIIAVFIIFANTMLCTFIVRDPNLWSYRVNRVMFSMGIADLLTGLILIPQAYREHQINPNRTSELQLNSSNSDNHYFDPSVCRILTAGTWLSVTTSIYTFTIVSFARYIATVHEQLFERYFSPGTAYYSIIPCWVGGLIHAIPLLTDWNNRTTSDFTTCSLPIKDDAWLNGSLATVFVIPTLIILVCYGLVLRKVMQSEAQRTEGIHMTFVLSLLTLAFLVCWWPAIIYLSAKYDSDRDSRAFYFCFMNSLINPLLFMSLNTTLRRKAKDFFQGIAAFCLCRGETPCKSKENTADPSSPIRNMDAEPMYFKVDDD